MNHSGRLPAHLKGGAVVSFCVRGVRSIQAEGSALDLSPGHQWGVGYTLTDDIVW